MAGAVFNSALILFGVVCLQTLGKADVGTKPAADLVVCIQSALEALEVVGKETRIVRRCSKYLRKIIQVSTLLGKFVPADRTWRQLNLPMPCEIQALRKYQQMSQHSSTRYPIQIHPRRPTEARILRYRPSLGNS